MAEENWADVRLSVSIQPTRDPKHPTRADWRLWAKAPGRPWTEREVVAHGSDRVAAMKYPPSREDMLAVMIEVLLGIRWEGAAAPYKRSE